jgi:hypothetical protein
MSKHLDPRRIEKTGDMVRYAESQGYNERESGNHIIMTKPGCNSLSIPRHGSMSPGVRRSILKLILGKAYYSE